MAPLRYNPKYLLVIQYFISLLLVLGTYIIYPPLYALKLFNSRFNMDLIVVLLKVFITIRLVYFIILKILYVAFEQDVQSLILAIVAAGVIYLLWAFDDIKKVLFAKR